MVDNSGKEETDAVDALLAGISYELAALFSILERKGIVTRAEFLDEIKKLRREVKPPADPDPYVYRG